MINEKKSSEVIETSLIYLLSAAVAVGAFAGLANFAAAWLEPNVIF